MLMTRLYHDPFDDLFDSFFEGNTFMAPRFNAPASSAMSCDVQELPDHYEIHLELPGYTKEDIKADLNQGYLTITAEHNEEKKEDTKYLHRERFYGKLQRSFYVGDAVAYEDIHAAFENGILKVAVAKKDPEPQPEHKYITIEG